MKVSTWILALLMISANVVNSQSGGYTSFSSNVTNNVTIPYDQSSITVVVPILYYNYQSGITTNLVAFFDGDVINSIGYPMNISFTVSTAGVYYLDIFLRDLSGYNYQSERHQINVTKEDPPPLAAAISGPTSLNPYENGTWTAVTSGGSTPYNYQWFMRYPTLMRKPPSGYWISIGGDSQILTRHDTENFELKCVVTDNNNNSVTTNIIRVSVR